MSSVVSSSLLLMIICFSSCSLQDPLEKVTVVKGHLGKNISIQCATENKKQAGVYMYRKKPEETNKQEIFYFYLDGTFTLNKEANVTIIKRGTFPNLTITFFNLTVTDSALYWCEFNLEDKITFSMVTWLWVTDPHSATFKEDRNAEECPENDFLLYVTIACTVFSVIILLCIIGYAMIVKMKRCKGKKYEPAKPPESSVYEEMSRSKLSTLTP